MTSETKYYDEVFTRIENGEVVMESWVFENGVWGYRELTIDEARAILGLEGK